ncbi:MAG TPA: hypothetical protein VLG11_02165 [Candidatus Saccharimonadales bacterium]|nr:hypothetical protein [Candidatus Saccharimonadales bacterium]
MKTPEHHRTHDNLVTLHRAIGGEVLSAYGSRTRVLEQRDDTAYVVWGADYMPVPRLVRWLTRPLLRPGKIDPELGIPTALPPIDGWLTKAVRLDNGDARLTQYEYSTGCYRSIPDLSQVREGDIKVPFESLEIGDLRAGHGFNRCVSVALGQSNIVSSEGLEAMTATLNQLLQHQIEAARPA